MNPPRLPEGGESLRVAYFAGTMRPGHDGVTRVLYRWIEGLERAGIKYMFFSPIVPPANERRAPMYKVPSVTFPLYKDYRLAVPGFKHFEEELRAFRPDLLHINSPCPLGYAAVKYGQKHGVPVVATYHTHFPSYAKYYKVKALELFSWSYFRKLYNGCDRVYVPSEPVLRELERHHLHTVSYLPHGVDTDVFSPSYRSEAWREKQGVVGRRVLLFAGRLVWEKDLRVLAEASRIITARRKDAVFVLVGDGPIREELESLMPGALFLGHQSGAALSAAYASSDMLVFPSTTETFGNVVVEAMASGLPAVCARAGGPAGIVRHGRTGLLAEPGDPEDFARMIEALLDDAERRAEYSRAALAFAREQSWDRVLARMFASYEDVISNAAARSLHRQRKAA